MRAFLVLAALVACTLAQCVWKDQTGRTWDLTRANRASADYETAPNANKEIFYFQPCQGTITCKSAPPPGPWTSPLCQKDGVGNWHSCGALGTAVPTFTNNQLSLNYTNGDNGRSALIKYICGGSLPGTIEGQIGEPGGKVYILTFKSPVGCYAGQSHGGGGGGGFDGGWVFVIIVLCGLTLYFIAGFLILKFARGASGLEAVPQGEFWFSLPGLVKDGAMFIVGKFTGGSSAGYQQVK